VVAAEGGWEGGAAIEATCREAYTEVAQRAANMARRVEVACKALDASMVVYDTVASGTTVEEAHDTSQTYL
jgi:hypothetical protein